MGAVAKFAAGGKAIAKKDLALIAMQYGHVYVAHVAFGAKDSQTVTAFREAEAYDGPALIIAYSHCIAHGFPLHLGLEQQKLAVDTGYWPLFRYDPRLAAQGRGRRSSSTRRRRRSDLSKFMANETRFGILKNVAPARAAELGDPAQAQIKRHYALYQHLAAPAAAATVARRAPAAGAGLTASPSATPPHHEPRHHLPRTQAPQSADRRRLALQRQASTPPASSRTPAPRPSSCARSSRSKSTPSSAP